MFLDLFVTEYLWDTTEEGLRIWEWRESHGPVLTWSEGRTEDHTIYGDVHGLTFGNVNLPRLSRVSPRVGTCPFTPDDPVPALVIPGERVGKPFVGSLS